MSPPHTSVISFDGAAHLKVRDLADPNRVVVTEAPRVARGPSALDAVSANQAREQIESKAAELGAGKPTGGLATLPDGGYMLSYENFDIYTPPKTAPKHSGRSLERP